MENKRLDFADALRGYAIIGVIAVHCWVALNPINISSEWFKNLVISGRFGVQLFFIASAFTLFYSMMYAHNAHEGWRSFFIRRLFRILPMFYFAIITYSILLTYNWFPIIGTSIGDADIINILSHLILVFIFDPTHVNTLVPGGWSIATELVFYLTIPIIFMTIKKITHACILLMCSIIVNIGLIIYMSETAFGKANAEFMNSWLPNQFPVFSLGILLFFILKEILFDSNLISKLSTLKRQVISTIILFSSITTFYYFIFIYQSSLNSTILLYGVSISFLLFAVSLSIYQFKLLVNKCINYLGKISYSCYLLHFIVISIFSPIILKWMGNSPSVIITTILLVAIISATLSHITYTYIELPGISIGKRLIEDLK